MGPGCLLLFLLFPLNVDSLDFRMKQDHVTYNWRENGNLGTPNFERAVVWTRHEQVGIGNALGGYVRVMEDSMVEGRELVIRSFILQKFCKIVSCSMEEFNFKPSREADIRKASHFQIQLRTPHKLDPNNPEEAGMLKVQEVSGCSKLPPYIPASDVSWPGKCLYSKLIRNFIVNGEGKLAEYKDWIYSYYVGNRDRFDAVIAVDKTQPKQVFDVTIHIRTLALIEDLSTEDGAPLEVEAKTEKFLRSEQFEAMVSCYAQNIAEEANEPNGRTISVYLATDAAGVRESFAKRLVAATSSIFSSKFGKNSSWKVEVDYFKATLPPAMYFLWTNPLQEMKEDDWMRLAGTTAEWLFLSQGVKMLTVKGLGGGERAMASSFALSAAGFGQTRDLLFLYGSANTCRWEVVAHFS